MTITAERVREVAPLLGLMRDVGSAHGGKTPAQARNRTLFMLTTMLDTRQQSCQATPAGSVTDSHARNRPSRPTWLPPLGGAGPGPSVPRTLHQRCCVGERGAAAAQPPDMRAPCAERAPRGRQERTATCSQPEASQRLPMRTLG